MRYDFYTRERLYKPGIAKQARNRLHRKVLEGLAVESVCEIGVGFGEFARYCRDHKIEYVGIEPNKGLRQALSDESFTVYDAMLPNFPDITEPFDTIFASHVIEHMNGIQEATQFLESCRNQLIQREGGQLVLLYPDIERCGNLFWADYTHNFVTTKKRIEEMLLDNGWQMTRSGYYTACFFRPSTLISWVGKFVPYFLLPYRIAEFWKLSFQQHAFTIAEPRTEKE